MPIADALPLAGSEGSDSWPVSKVAATALAVCLAYLLGAQAGLLLRLPGATPSVLWPPNALMTCALLLLPRRYWVVALVGAFPAHLTISLGTDWPIGMIVLLFLTNCSEALIGASLLRRFSDAPTRFDSLERVFAFVACVVLAAPFLSSFLDAAAVSSFRAESYWPVWRARTLSNVLTELTIVPAVVGLVTAASRAHALPSPARLAEAAVLGLSAVGTWSISLFAIAGYPIFPGVERVPLAFLLPFIAWGAMRFGPLGASVTVLAATLLTIFAAARDVGPFVSLSPGEAVVGVQFLLIAAALPHLVLAAAIEERRQSSQALAARLSFERLLGELAHAFLEEHADGTSESYASALRDVGERLEIDAVILLRREADRLVPLAAWYRSPAMAMTDPGAEFPWAVEAIVSRREVRIDDVSDFPVDASTDRRSFRLHGFRSGVGIPLTSSDRAFGCLAFLTTGSRHDLRQDPVERFRLIAEIFAAAMVRQQTEAALRASEQLKTAILTSLASGVAVIDRSGRIVAQNQRWTVKARDAALAWATGSIGADLLSNLRRAAECDDTAQHLLSGIGVVLAGEMPRHVVHHSRPGPDGTRYWVLSVHPLHRAEGGVVLTHTDLTDQKRAELDAQMARDELAHLARVAAVGELTASLAHQLNQPLAAIVANARAGQRLLTAGQMEELAAVFEDVAADGLRAGAIVRGVRDMLRKERPAPANVDVTALVRDVTALVGNDALIRQVNVHAALPPWPIIVHGDRIQLQQVLLNLVLNAIEAAADGAGARRVIEVDACTQDGDTAVISVRDCGPGLPPPIARVFEAFFTTKPSGMGMGLPIARSIVEAHGGTISAANNQNGGATLTVHLPLASGDPQ